MNENTIEQFAISQLKQLGYEYVYGPTIAPEGERQERNSFEEVVLEARLRKALERINPNATPHMLEQAVREVLRVTTTELIANNEHFHKLLTEGVLVQYQQGEDVRGDYVQLIDLANPANNEFLVVNQFTVIERHVNKRTDIMLFINGLPLVLIELKNATDEKATIEKAFDQVGTYKATIPSLFTYNAFCVISDGLNCKAGTISSALSRYMAWKTRDGKTEASHLKPQLEILIEGMLAKDVLLDLVQNFIVFEKTSKEDASGLVQIETIKKIAAYHQYHAVNKAVTKTAEAATANGSHQGGVIWHTQGSGKSLSMVFYTGKLVRQLNNPTVVVITDRNDLDEQLFDTFAGSRQLLRQEPVQAKSREHLKELLRVASGGIVFTTIQKFLPDEGKSEYEELTNRSNVVVIADEAHRTQYGFEAELRDVRDKESKEVIGKRLAYGFAKYLRDALPNATYIGFTGTPIEGTDVNTKRVFGDYVDIYDISQSIADGATVKIYYESRLAKVNLDEEGKQLIEEFDKELEENDELSERQKAKGRWARLEAIVGHPSRIKNLARDIVDHYEKRSIGNNGKAIIVAMSRRIATLLYEEIRKVRASWHNDDLGKGKMKVVMTSSSSDRIEPDPERPDEMVIPQYMRTNKEQRRSLAARMKDPADELQIVIVRDMWLTGFDAPCLHTLYIDKPMRGHNLMQAIARVNRVFGEKTGGLIVDYLGIATDMKKALAFYSDAGGKGEPTDTQERAVELMQEKLEVVRQMFEEKSSSRDSIIAAEPQAYYGTGKGFNYERFFKANTSNKLFIIRQAEEHISGLQNGKERFIKEVTLLSRAFALALPHDDVVAVKEEIAFYQAVRACLLKFTEGEGGKDTSSPNAAIKLLVEQAISSDKVIDIFEAAGIEKPEISILSNEFLKEVEGMKFKNLAFELLRKLLNDEIKARSKKNIVRSKKLFEMLENAIRKYQNGLLTTAEIIQELIGIAKEVKADDERVKELNLNEDEIAFYDALEANDSAVKVLGDDTLRNIAREIAEKVKANTSIDWTLKESARAKLMVIVRRTLNKYGYPPDKQEQAVLTVLRQAEAMADELVSIY